MNVCTVSDYAPYLKPEHEDWPLQVTQERAREDHRFLECLTSFAGISMGAIHEIDLGWSDAPLRRAIPAESVLGESICEEAEVQSLCAAMALLPQADAVLAPMALGGHMDHQLVHHAALRTFAGQVGFYEEQPYAARMASQERQSRASAVARMHLRRWSSRIAQAAGTKRMFAMCYPSQIAPEVADEMESDAQQHGGVECFYVRDEMLGMLAQAEGRLR